MCGVSKVVTPCHCGALCIYANKVFDPELDDVDIGPCEGQVNCIDYDYVDGDTAYYGEVHCCSNPKHSDRYFGC